MTSNLSLIILRGLPGAGKSTLAALLGDGKWPVFSIDDYFTDANGNYHFEFDQNYLAYQHCQQRTEAAMVDKTQKIFIANTFTLAWEIEPYFALAKKYGYQVHVATVEKRHTQGNSHGVTDDQIRKMATNYTVHLF